MVHTKKLLYNAQIFFENNLQQGYILINDKIIEDIGLGKVPNKILNSISNKNNIFDCNNSIVIPGFIDVHVHFRDSDQAYKETLISGSKGALISGVTTVLSMPNTIPPLSTQINLHNYLKLANRSPPFCNIGFYSTVKSGFNIDELNKMKHMGIFGLKIYPGDSSNQFRLHWNSIWEKDLSPKDFSFHFQDKSHLLDESYENWELLFKSAKELDLPISFHPELPKSEEKLQIAWEKGIQNSKNSGVINRNLTAHDIQHSVYSNELGCIEMISTMINHYFPEPSKAPHIHFVHVSHPDCVEIIRETLQKRGYSASIEVTPHHILLNNSMKFQQESYAKVLVPLRSEISQIQLYQKVKDGFVDIFGTDHAPHSLDEKNQDFRDCPAGFPYIDFASRILLTEVFNHNLTLKQLLHYYSEHPAKLFHIKNKGKIAIGYDADLVILREVEPYSIKSKDMISNQKWTPWENKKINAQIDKVFLAGNLAYDHKVGILGNFGKIIKKNE